MSSSEPAVVIVSFAQPRLLAACLASIREPATIIVVDNAGDEPSRAVAAGDARVRWISSGTNRGFAAACNLGWQASSSGCVVFLNSDAELFPESLATMRRVLEERPKAGAVAPRLVFPDGRHQPSTGDFPKPFGYVLSRVFPSHARGYHARGSDRARAVDWATGACLAVRRTALEAVGGFSEDYFLNLEDVDLCRRLSNAGWHVWYTPDATVRHHVGGSSGSDASGIVAREKRRSQLIYFAKHHGRAAFEIVRWLNASFALWNALRGVPPSRAFWHTLRLELTAGSKEEWSHPAPLRPEPRRAPALPGATPP